MALTLISLNAATSAGPGSVLSFQKPQSNFSCQVTFTGAPTTCVVNLEGTIDGSNFYALQSVSVSAGSLINGVIIGPTLPGNTAGIGGPVTGVRANLVSLGGGTSPTVTATLAVQE